MEKKFKVSFEIEEEELSENISGDHDLSENI